MGVAMAKVMGHVALGLCESERPASLAIDEAQLPAGSTLMICPIGCAVTSAGQGVLVAIFEPVVVAQGPPARVVRAALAGAAGQEAQTAVAQEEQRLRRQREQLMVLARRLAGVLQ
jgi:hypothetical protein